MKKYIPLLILILFILAFGSGFFFLVRSGAFIMKSNEIDPAPSIKTTEKKEQKREWDEAKFGKLRVLDIGQNDCVSCVKMHQISEEMNKEFKGKVIFSVIDINVFPNVIDEYNITTIPTVIVLDGFGRTLFRREDVWYKTEIREFFAQLGIKP